MLKALINKLLLILNGHRKNIFAALGLHTTKISIIYYASVTEMLLLLFLHCGVSNHPCSGKKLFLKLFLPSFLYLSCALSFSLSILFLFSETLETFYPLLFPFRLSALSHIHFCSSSLHLVDDSLVFEWCAFCSMICSVVSLLLPGLSLPSPPPSSPPWKPTDFNVRVCLRRLNL